MMAMRTAHHSYAASVAICTAAAARLPGTIVPSASSETVRIAHPFGVMDVGVKMNGAHVVSARIGRTARRIMSGFANVS